MPDSEDLITNLQKFTYFTISFNSFHSIKSKTIYYILKDILDNKLDKAV